MSFSNKELELFNPLDFPTNAALYARLERSGYGTAVMFESRYKRDTEGFRTAVLDWRNTTKTSLEDVVQYTPSKSLSDVDYRKYRAEVYERQRTKYMEETARYGVKIGDEWGCQVFISDTHLEDEASNLELLLSMIEYFGQYRNVGFADLGDVGNWFNSAGDWGARINKNAELNIDDTVKSLHMYLAAIPVLNVFTVGNHEEFLINSAGYDFVKPIVLHYHPNCIYRRYNAVVKFTTDNTQSEWIKLTHKTSGRSKNNNHHGPINNLKEQELDVNTIVTGHYHYDTTTVASFNTSRRKLTSIALGSIKSWDSFAMHLGYPAGECKSPFAFMFLDQGNVQWFDTIAGAARQIELLEAFYG